MAFEADSSPVELLPLLRRSLERGRLGHAYLFVGAELDALKNAGNALAQGLNCLQPPETAADGLPLQACGECVSCAKISRIEHPDVMWVKPESMLRQIRISQIVRRHDSPPRVVHDLVYQKPTEGQWKVAVLEAADRLNSDAANSLLKSLEEPPPQTVFVLLSTEPERLLDTIRSRCLQLTLPGEGAAEIRAAEMDWLAEFAGMAAGEERGLFGRYRLLGNLVKNLSEVKASVVDEMAQAAQENEREEVPVERNEDERKASVESEYRLRRAGYLKALQAWLRDVWLHSAGIDGGLARVPSLATEASAVGARLSPEDAMANLRQLERTQGILHTTVNEQNALEVGLLKLKL